MPRERFFRQLPPSRRRGPTKGPDVLDHAGSLSPVVLAAALLAAPGEDDARGKAALPEKHQPVLAPSRGRGRIPGMHVIVDVNKPKTKGASDFIQALPKLLEASETWKLRSSSPLKATIQSTATMSSLPEPPSIELAESGAGSVVAKVVNQNWTREQQAHAMGPFLYLCLTSLASHVTQIRIDV